MQWVMVMVVKCLEGELCAVNCRRLFPNALLFVFHLFFPLATVSFHYASASSIHDAPSSCSATTGEGVSGNEEGSDTGSSSMLHAAL